MRSLSRLALPLVLISLGAQAAPDKMKAAEVGDGGVLSVQVRPVPRPGVGEVLIRVRAAGVNPVDWKIAMRRLGMVPGTDVAGTIDTLGEGVTGWKVGEPVLGFARQSGSYAEYAVIPVGSLAKKPASMTFEQAAGVPIAAETAYRALHEAGIFVNPVVAPATPPNQALIRLSVMATHTEEQLSAALEVIEKIGRELGVI